MVLTPIRTILASGTRSGATVSQTRDIKPEVDIPVEPPSCSPSGDLQQHRGVSGRAKLLVYNASGTSVLLYGAGTWRLNDTLAAWLDGLIRRPQADR